MKNIIQRRVSIKHMTKAQLDTETNAMYQQPEKSESNKASMNQMIVKSLNSKNPQMGKNTTFFSYQDLRYVTQEEDEHLLNILDMESSILHKNDRNFIVQEEYHRNKSILKRKIKKAGEEYKENEKDSIRSMRNQLNYCERTSQTLNPQIISREVETVKLQRNNHCGIFHNWDLFDKYMTMYIANEEQHKREEAAKFGIVHKERVKKVEKNVDSVSRPSMLKTLKLVERQIMQILNSDQYLCYREWHKQDDTADSSKMLLMLLAFPQNATIRNKSVTALCWNEKYEDLFAVGYGSYAFPKKKEEKDKLEEERSDDTLDNGYIFVFSVKNNYFPEIKYKTESGVLSLDFHPKQFSLLVAGMYDGTVAVYDIKHGNGPIITCDIRTQKHMDPVWQVKWFTPFTEPDENVFFSISSDGKVVKWSFFKSKTTLEHEEIITLKYPDGANDSVAMNTTSNTLPIGEAETKEKMEDPIVFGNAGGTCFSFNPHKNYDHLFVLGTEEGHIHLCSVNHRGHCMQTYEGHTMGVYTVAWNPFHEKIFASCSADWTIKIWHYKIVTPLVIYDMQNAVGDISWSPWCSTIFSAVTVVGDMKFFDLNRARKTPLEPKKYQEIAINHIAFNKYEYVFLTGNDRGKVRMWKMAEPLRTTVSKKEEEEKEKEKKQGNSQKALLPETKVVIPKNLQQATTKTRKHIEIKKDNKREMLNSQAFLAEEKERIVDFLKLLDVNDI